VAYCQGWYDEANQVGLFEPVGTVADHRRRGLARAAGIEVLHAFRDAGGRTAQVYARGDDAYPVPKQVYQDLGFMPYARTVRYRR
jgi:predicted GNAT family acetyltransferase